MTVTLDLPTLDQPVDILAVGMGNPHAVLFLEQLDGDGNSSAIDVETMDIATPGAVAEHCPHFPNRTNVEFVRILPSTDSGAGSGGDSEGAALDAVPTIRQRTWERGSGETEACGTGACATAVAAILSGRVAAGPVRIRLNGGDLMIHWAGGDDDAVTMTGEAVVVFEGVWPSSRTD